MRGTEWEYAPGLWLSPSGCRDLRAETGGGRGRGKYHARRLCVRMLALAISMGDRGMVVEYLLAKGADVNGVKGYDFMSPLMVAASKGIGGAHRRCCSASGASA